MTKNQINYNRYNETLSQRCKLINGHYLNETRIFPQVAGRIFLETIEIKVLGLELRTPRLG